MIGAHRQAAQRVRLARGLAPLLLLQQVEHDLHPVGEARPHTKARRRSQQRNASQCLRPEPAAGEEPVQPVPDEFRGKNFVSEYESPATRQLCEEATAQDAQRSQPASSLSSLYDVDDDKASS